MAVEIFDFVLGPIENNTYLVVDNETKNAAIVDPSFDSKNVIEQAMKRGNKITQIWCTHAHFDHIIGINEIMPLISPKPVIYLHPDDLPLWNSQGGAKLFGFPFEIDYQPTHFLMNDDTISLGQTKISTNLTPGHSSGHVIYYIPEDHVVFCGDLIFRMSVGRTDLPGGNHQQLIQSIHQAILNLPDDTRLLSGHGPETTVGFEKENNPFL